MPGFVLLFGLAACAQTTTAPDKTEQDHARQIREGRARSLHDQLAKCRDRPSHFCRACLDNEPTFLDEHDRSDFLEICRNVVAYRRCAPGYESPNLPANVRRAACDESTWGQISDTETEQESDEAVGEDEPPEPSREEQQRLKRDLARAIQEIDEEDATSGK